MANTIRHGVRTPDGRVHLTGVAGKGGIASAIATASHNATRSGKRHDVVEIDTATGAARVMPVKPAAANQVARSTGQGG